MKKELKYIGVAGRKHAGKSYFVHKFLQPCRFVSFAAPMRRMVYALGDYAGVDMETYDTPEMKETPIPELGGVTFRRLMQTLGTEWGRGMLGSDFWINVEKGRSGKKEEWNGFYVPDRLVYDDVRFKNEADFIHGRGGIVVYIYDGDEHPEIDHASEDFNLTWADFIVDNSKKGEIVLPAELEDIIQK